MTPMTPNDGPGPSVPSVSSADRRARRRSRLNVDVPDDTVAAYSAARAFLFGEWFGATLAVASFTLLYLFAFAGRADTRWGFGACLAMLAVGAWAYLRSRTYYLRVGFDYAPKWHVGALIVAGSAAIFWLLFAFLAALAYFGFPVAPVD
jgi:hypothetical protein